MLPFACAFRARFAPAGFDVKSLRRKSTVTAIAVLAFAAIAAHAQAASGAPINSASNQSRQICQAVIGVRPTDTHFEGCVASLNASLQDVARDEAISRAQSDCFRQGLKPRSADLSLCLLKADDANTGADTDVAPHEPDAGGMKDPEAVGSYTAASFDVVFHREREACARLGIDPNSGAFAGCVSSLQDQLQRLDFSSN